VTDPLATPRPTTADSARTPASTPLPGLPLPTLRDIELTVDQAGYEAFSDGVRKLLGFDLTQYKRPQVWRRANSFAKQHGFENLVDLVEECRTDLDLRTELRDMITINVSEFFRNPDAWELVRANALANLLKLGRPIRFWSAGCSLGYEPYTWAMLVKEAGGGTDTKILATDLDETILAQARASSYGEVQMVGLSQARRARFFEQTGDHWVVKPELRNLVQWRRQDLLRDPFPSDYDIIACRNVVIYFTDEAKDALYRRFAHALRLNGYLFIGATEAIGNWRSFGLTMLSSGLYQRTEA
jgi:chemotaxis protein methyltransferase CheR